MMGYLYSAHLILGLMSITSSALYLDDSKSARLNSQFSSCKKKSYQAFKLCRNELAINEKEQLACAKQYVSTFPMCYFQGIDRNSDCDRGILTSFTNCVRESMSSGEKFACMNMESLELAKCGRKETKKEAQYDAMALTRRNLQACNKCDTEVELCSNSAFKKEVQQLCIANHEVCRAQNGC